MPQMDLVLILARDLADKLASAAFLVDHDGTLLYFNERSAEILGKTFAEVGEMKMEEWAGAFSPTDFDGNPIPSEKLPLVKAVVEREPEHGRLRIHGADGESHDIEVTAIPLFARLDDFVGALAVFWKLVGSETKGQA
jgi:PAS domain-containing protein